MFTAGLVTSPVRGEDLYGVVIAFSIIFIGIPTLLLTSLFGGLSLSLSRPATGAGTFMLRVGVVVVAAASMSAAMYLLIALARGLDALALFALGVSAFYLLWRNVRGVRRGSSTAAS
jgi:hypothetical protein